MQASASKRTVFCAEWTPPHLPAGMDLFLKSRGRTIAAESNGRGARHGANAGVIAYEKLHLVLKSQLTLNLSPRADDDNRIAGTVRHPEAGVLLNQDAAVD